MNSACFKIQIRAVCVVLCVLTTMMNDAAVYANIPASVNMCMSRHINPAMSDTRIPTMSGTPPCLSCACASPTNQKRKEVPMQKPSTKQYRRVKRPPNRHTQRPDTHKKREERRKMSRNDASDLVAARSSSLSLSLFSSRRLTECGAEQWEYFICMQCHDVREEEEGEGEGSVCLYVCAEGLRVSPRGDEKGRGEAEFTVLDHTVTDARHSIARLDTVWGVE